MNLPAAPASLRLRFLLSVLLWVVLGTGGIWYSATRVFQAHVEQGYHEELEVHVRELARLTRIGPDGRPALLRPLSDPRYDEPLSGFYWQVGVPGRPSLKSASMTRGSLDETVAHSPNIAHQTENGPTGPAITYGFTKPLPGAGPGDVHFVIATDQRLLDQTVASFTRELTFWLLALAMLLLATGIAIIGFGLKPLERLATAIGRLRRGETELLEGGYPTEIAPLVTDLNEYIHQNGAMIARARVQAGNLAHSLRTPLAVIMDEAERLAEGASPTAASTILLEQAGMMERQIEYQLAHARARAGSGARIPGAASTMPELLLPILNAMHRLHPERRFTLDNALAGSVSLPVDPVDLTELLSILLDNAGKWARDEVRIGIVPVPDGLEVVVEDDGPGLTAEQLARAGGIGVRFDPATPGSGFGLAIAKDICEAIGAQLDLSCEAGGLLAAVRLPGPINPA
ncbi:MAG: HAMP domain-containing sensor histidine kinase [Croceibacterium sp.]